MTGGPAEAAIMVAIGIVAGVLGTLVGLGGGFVVVPVLRIAFGIAPATTAGISLVMVLANAVSGSFAYLRQGRADLRTASLVAITGIPFSVIGALLVGKVSFASFDVLYGALLVYFFIDVMRRRRRTPVTSPPRFPGLRERSIVDARGETFSFLTSTPLVLLCGAILGFSSSFFGIGGGTIFVLFFISLFRMPPHVLTATSTLAILLTSPAGVLSHAFAHDIVWPLAVPLAAGGLIGGQIGPRIARRLPSPRLLDALAGTILLAAIGLVARHVPHIGWSGR